MEEASLINPQPLQNKKY